MKLILRTISLPLRHVFRTSHGANTVQENLLVELRDGDLAGYGEGTSFNYYDASAAGMTADLEAARAKSRAGPRSIRPSSGSAPCHCWAITASP